MFMSIDQKSGICMINAYHVTDTRVGRVCPPANDNFRNFLRSISSEFRRSSNCAILFGNRKRNTVIQRKHVICHVFNCHAQ